MLTAECDNLGLKSVPRNFRHVRYSPGNYILLNMGSYQRPNLGVKLAAAEMHQFNGPGRTLRRTGAAPFALYYIYLRLTLDVDDRNVVGTHPHAGQTGGAVFTRNHGHYPADGKVFLGKDGTGPRYGSARLGYAFRDQFRRMGCSGKVDTVAGKIHRPQLHVRLEEESFRSPRHLQEIGQFLVFPRHGGR
jgi:hypothetical protein